VVLIYTGRTGEADATLSEALVLKQEVAHPDNAYVGISLNNLGVCISSPVSTKNPLKLLKQAYKIDEKRRAPPAD